MSDEPIAIAIDFECKDVTKALEKLKAHLKSRTVMDEIGFTVAKWGRARIKSRANQAPDGSTWESLAASTIKAKQNAGKGHMGTLMFEPKLMNSINHQVTSDDSVSIGSSMLYAMIHQEGGMAGRGRKVRIPARPYIGLSDKEKRLIEEKVVDWVKKILKQ